MQAKLIYLAGLTDLVTAERFTPYLIQAAEEFEINTPKRQSAWLAQCSHESGHFKRLVENLNYSKIGLLSVFPRYFDYDTAELYAYKPKEIANRVYANRMGNGNVESGEGWKYRGRGLIQITGKNNVRAFARYLDREDEILDDPDLLLTPELAARSAGWFWQRNGLNELADGERITEITKRINGGINGLDDRKKLYAQATAFFC